MEFPTEFTEWLAWLVVLVGIPLNIVATLLLRKTWKQAPHLRVLRERYVVAALLTIVVIVFGLIFVQNDMSPPPLDLDVTKWITRLVMLLIATVPAVAWLLLYRSIRRDSSRPNPSTES